MVLKSPSDGHPQASLETATQKGPKAQERATPYCAIPGDIEKIFTLFTPSVYESGIRLFVRIFRTKRATPSKGRGRMFFCRSQIDVH